MQAAHTGRLASVELLPTNCAACNGPLPVQARIVRNWSLPSRVVGPCRAGSGFTYSLRHSGRAFETGVSAVYGLARVLQEVEGLSDLERGVTVNVGPMTGGTATNVVPDHAAAWGNARFSVKADGAALIKSLEALATGDGAMPRVVVHHSFNRPAKPLIPQTQHLAEIAQAVAEELGQQLPFASTGGVCDGNILQDAGLATIDTLGARGGGLHTHEEWIDLESLVERATLLACLIKRLSELEPSAHTHQ